MRRLLLSCLAVLLSACSQGITVPPARTLSEFESRLETLRSDYHVPGLSAIIDGPSGTVWEHAYGQADIATGKPVSAETMFHLASLTKPMAAVIALQLDAEGVLDLDAPAARYGINVGGADSVRLWHLLSHTSESTPPGTAYSYSGNRYGMIEDAFTRAAGRTFAQLFDARIRAPLQLTSTAPNPRSSSAAQIGLDPAVYGARLARGYSYGSGSYTLITYESYFGPAAGMIATPRDVVRFSRALDGTDLLRSAERTRMWTAIRTPSGKILPYGIGWFVQAYHGETVLWHYGLWTGASALIIKLPSRGLTFVVLGNSPNLSNPFPLGAGDVTASPFAMLFLSSFAGGPLAASVHD
ncbi:MAG: serine hydrolase domain-containing protein [Longimicrobiales bacterium]